MDIKRYIESGVLEAYVTGAASPDEEREVLYLKAQYPEINNALNLIEEDLERLAGQMAVMPPPGTWDKIEAEIDGIIAREKADPHIFTEKESYKTHTKPGTPQFIDVESQQTHMRVHKAWKWVFAAVFVLGKIFLACAIYFYLENRQAQKQVEELKTEVQQLKR